MKTVHKYTLGETTFSVEEIKNADGRPGPVYFHPHEDELTSYNTGVEMVAHTGGVMFALKHGGKRLISFVMDGKTYQIDPNRMFSRAGIASNLSKYGPCSDNAVEAVYVFSRWLSGLMISDQVFAIHNNYDTTYNVKSYVTDGHPAAGVRDVYINPDRDPGNFIYTTNATLFAVAKVNGYNTVLQDPGVEDDGSYSVFAQRHNIDYINVETKRGDAKNDLELVAFVNRFYGYMPPIDSPWALLKQDALIDLVATSSAYSAKSIPAIEAAFKKLGFRVRTKYAVQASPPPLGYSNSDDMRLEQLLAALNDPDSDAVWCIRGGAGSTNLLPRMMKATRPARVKPLIGFSDVTGVGLFLAGQWGWPTIHGVVANFNAEVDAELGARINHQTSLTSVTNLLSGSETSVTYTGLTPLNAQAKAPFAPIDTCLSGGNLTLVVTALSTPFYRTKENDVALVLEDIGNSAHQLERLLDQMAYSNAIQRVRAVILGEFLHSSAGDSAAMVKDTDTVLQRFADRMNVPVFRLKRFGHGAENIALPMNTSTQITRGADGQVTLKIAAR